MQIGLKTEDLFLEEDSVEDALDRFDKVIAETKVVLSLERESFFNDEPKLYDFFTTYSSYGCNSKKCGDCAGGIDLVKSKALLKSLGEAFERHCLSIQKKKICSSYQNILDKAINIFEFNDFSSKQLSDPKFKQFVYDRNSKFYWDWGFDFFTLKKILVPSQLISVPYKYFYEQVIREPISTGAALSTSLGGAIYRGICEIVERDAFMITYLNKLRRSCIDLDKSGQQLKELKEIYSRYNLELIVVDVTTDLQISAMMGLVIDRTGIGPAISVGLSADLNPTTAAIKAVKEALHSRPWIRRLMLKNVKNIDVNSFEGRALYWSSPKMIDKLDFIINNTEKIILKSNIVDMSIREKITTTLRILKKSELLTYFVDLTTPKIKKNGFYVVKVIIPKLQPLYLNENTKCLGNERLKSVPRRLGFLSNIKLNDVPHPFL